MDYSEGVYSLLRAFRIAGTQNVLMKLWSLDDAKAREFMLCFYNKSLETDLAELAVALREIQLFFIRETDPRVWVPFALFYTRSL